MTVEAGVDEAGGGVDDQTETAQRTLALDTGDEVVGHTDALGGAAEHELARVEHERIVGAVADGDELGQVLLVLLHVDDCRGVVAEHAEEVADPDVDRGGLDHRVVERFDDDAASADLLAQGSVGEDHGLPR